MRFGYDGYDMVVTIVIVIAGALYIGWHFRPYVFPGAIILATIWVLWWAVPKLFKGIE